MKPAIHITFVWSDPPQSSTLAVCARTWGDIVEGKSPVSIRGLVDDPSGTEIRWRIHHHRITLKTITGKVVVTAPLSQALVLDSGYDEPLTLSSAHPPTVWPPPGVIQIPRGLAPWEKDPTQHPGSRLPPRYCPEIHETWRGRRPRATCTFRPAQGSDVQVQEPTSQIKLPRRPEPAPGHVDARIIPVLESWWLAQPCSEAATIREAFSRARRLARQHRPWYNRRDPQGRPIGIWHAVEELEAGVTLFNGGVAWLEWTWLIYSPRGILSPLRRSWSSALRSEPGIARASGHRSVRTPPAWHPALLARDCPVFDQTTPDPDQPGMVIRR